MKIESKNACNKLWSVILWGVTLVMFSPAFFLFYQYAMAEEGGRYYSDLILHIGSGRKGGGYSLLTKMLYLIISFDDNMLWIGLFLALVIMCTIVGIYWMINCFLKYYAIELDKKIVYLVSIMLIFVCNIYIPELFPFFYKGTACTQPWHNAPYILMRMFAIPTFALYIKMEKKYLDKIEWKDWIFFLVLLTLGNWAKPSFLIAFAPMMLIYLVCDFVMLRKWKPTIQMVKFGMAVLLSLPVSFYQASVLWKEGSGNGVTLKDGGVVNFFEREDWFFYIICGLLFPILVTLVSAVKKNLKNKLLIQTWVMYLISWLTSYFFTEYGKRSAHGNFGWGRKICGLLLFIVCFVELLALYKKEKITKKTYFILLIPLAVSVICGLLYYMLLLVGASYYR